MLQSNLAKRCRNELDEDTYGEKPSIPTNQEHCEHLASILTVVPMLCKQVNLILTVVPIVTSRCPCAEGEFELWILTALFEGAGSCILTALFEGAGPHEQDRAG